MAKKEVEIEIQGTGKETRSFCYVEDAVDQLITLYKNGVKGEIYRVGIDNEITVRDLINKMANILGIEVTIKTSNLKKVVLLGGAQK